jgi:AraC-like DNA-binding protein
MLPRSRAPGLYGDDTVTSTNGGWKCYHLLHHTVAADAWSEPALLGRAVRTAVSGFAGHFQYAAAARAAAPRLSAGELRRRLELGVDTDANPIAMLACSAADEHAFRGRWNAFNRLAYLGVNTEIGTSIVRSARTPLPDDTPFRRDLATQLAALLGRRTQGRAPDQAEPLRAIAARLGLRGALADLLGMLYADPTLDLEQCRKLAGCSARTLQRALSRQGLNFGLTRQAVRLTVAGFRLRHLDEPIARTAQESGFFDSAHLNHAWSAACGITPSAYRALARLAA